MQTEGQAIGNFLCNCKKQQICVADQSYKASISKGLGNFFVRLL